MPWLFLDFEASSLGKDSYPIEVGWVFENGNGNGRLIRPAADWDDWDPAAEAIHGIPLRALYEAGDSVEDVCAELVGLAQTHTLLASAPSWDGHWLSMLLRAAGQPRHLIRLQDSDVAFEAAARQRLGRDATDEAVASLIARARSTVESAPAQHRAGPDARREWHIWRTIQDMP